MITILILHKSAPACADVVHSLPCRQRGGQGGGGGTKMPFCLRMVKHARLKEKRPDRSERYTVL